MCGRGNRLFSPIPKSIWFHSKCRFDMTTGDLLIYFCSLFKYVLALLANQSYQYSQRLISMLNFQIVKNNQLKIVHCYWLVLLFCCSDILFIRYSMISLFSLSYIFLITEDLIGMILGLDMIGVNCIEDSWMVKNFWSSPK